MTSDRWLVRLVGVTVCTLAVIALASTILAEHRGIATPLSERLAFLLAGGLLGALTTRLTGERVSVTTKPGDALDVREVEQPPAPTPAVAPANPPTRSAASHRRNP